MNRTPARPVGNLMPRYRGIISSWDAFAEACDRPAPTVLRANSLKTSPERLRSRIQDLGVDAIPFAWDPLLVQVDQPLGRTIEHWLGHFYIQEATQTAPVRVLDPQPGERVLDLCAAPGGKTVQIATSMRNRGALVANEPNGRRQPALLANINRLGVLHALVTSYRGEAFPMRESFDRVLVDAPCSGEGTVRKDRSVISGARPTTIRRLSRIQERLLVRGYDLLRPGGTLVYSTCTFAPEENEAIVSYLVGQREAEILPIHLPFDTSPGLTGWQEAEYPKEMARCARIYPHHLDSGGGFVAHVRRPS